MKKIIAAIALSLSLVGCASQQQQRAEVRHTVYKEDYKEAFVELVSFVRENQFNTKPSQAVQERLNRLIFEAGMEMKNLPDGKRRLVHNGREVSFDYKTIHVRTSPGTVVKTEDLNSAARLIYDPPSDRFAQAK